jgi:hypothetical protein
MDVFGAGVNVSHDSLTPTGCLWANMTLEIVSSVKRDKTPYHG